MKQAASIPIYDDRVNTTIKGLMAGESREELAKKFSLGSWKSLDIYMRRKGFNWDSGKQNYIPAGNASDRVVDAIQANIPVKAEKIINMFEREDADPRSIAGEMGFDDHREMAAYMEKSGLRWDPVQENYVEVGKQAAVAHENATEPETAPLTSAASASRNTKRKKSAGGSDHDVVAESANSSGSGGNDDDNVLSFSSNKGGKGSQEKKSSSLTGAAEGELINYLPLLQLLERNKERLLDLLMPASEGHIPKYAVPGIPKTKSIYMSNKLARLVSEFSESKNLSQREIVEAAVIEYLRRYGFQSEIDFLLQKK